MTETWTVKVSVEERALIIIITCGPPQTVYVNILQPGENPPQLPSGPFDWIPIAVIGGVIVAVGFLGVAAVKAIKD